MSTRKSITNYDGIEFLIFYKGEGEGYRPLDHQIDGTSVEKDEFFSRRRQAMRRQGVVTDAYR